VICLRD